MDTLSLSPEPLILRKRVAKGEKGSKRTFTVRKFESVHPLPLSADHLLFRGAGVVGHVG
jgi:hypothetical protein